MKTVGYLYKEPRELELLRPIMYVEPQDAPEGFEEVQLVRRDEAAIAEARQAETIALANASGLCRWKEKILKAADVTFAGNDAPRFKLFLRKNGTASNVFPKELDGAWVAFQRAEDDAHIGMLALLDMQGEHFEKVKLQRDEMARVLSLIATGQIYDQDIADVASDTLSRLSAPHRDVLHNAEVSGQPLADAPLDCRVGQREK